MRILTHEKSSLAPPGASLAFSLGDESGFHWIGEYDITGVTDLLQGKYQTAHGGYDQTYANQDPDRVLPVDVLRDLEKEGRIGSLHPLFYSTVGNARPWPRPKPSALRSASVSRTPRCRR